MSFAEPKERIHFRSKVEAMDQSADGQRDFDAFVMSVKGETSTNSFQDLTQQLLHLRCLTRRRLTRPAGAKINHRAVCGGQSAGEFLD